MANVNLINSTNIEVIQDGDDISLDFASGGQVEENTTNIENLSTYSTTETVIGTWINGKPLYRKIISVLIAANTTSNTSLSNEGINNPDIIIINTGKSVSHYDINIVGGAYNNPNYYSTTTDFGNVYVDGNKVMHIVNKSSGQRQYYICLEYTKTTD